VCALYGIPVSTSGRRWKGKKKKKKKEEEEVNKRREGGALPLARL
jgi:hypothetical protein